MQILGDTQFRLSCISRCVHPKYSNVICWCYSQVHQPQGLCLCDSFLSHKVSARALVHIGWIWLNNVWSLCQYWLISGPCLARRTKSCTRKYGSLRQASTAQSVDRNCPLVLQLMTVVDLPAVGCVFFCSEHSDREPIEFWLNIQVWTYSLDFDWVVLLWTVRIHLGHWSGFPKALHLCRSCPWLCELEL